MNNFAVYTPDPPFCQNTFCSNRKIKNVPTTGLYESERQCSDLKHILEKQISTGGRSGRGVVPCEFGYIQSSITGEKRLFPLEKYPGIAKYSIIQDPFSQPLNAVPQYEPRPLFQIGNVYRN